jgi:hypothetical protein
MVTGILKAMSRNLLQMLEAKSFHLNDIFGKIGIKMSPTNNPRIKNRSVMGRKSRNMGKPFHHAGTGGTENGSSMSFRSVDMEGAS